MISLDSNMNANANVADLLEKTAPSSCLSVFIGKKFNHRIDDIITKVETLSKSFNVKSPTFFVEKADKMPTIFHENPPVMVMKCKQFTTDQLTHCLFIRP